MKAALITDELTSRGGGIKEVVEGLSKALQDNGTQTHVFGLATKSWREGGADEWQGAPVHAAKIQGPEGLGYAPSFVSSLIDWAPDIVHVHGLWRYPSWAALRWAKQTDGCHVVSPHGMLNSWALQQAQPKKTVAKALYVTQLLRQAGCICASTTAEDEIIRRLYPSVPTKILYNGVEQKPRIKGPAPWQGHLPKEAKVMLFLGRFHPAKNLLGLLQAWHKIHGAAQMQDWYLVMAGWGAESDVEETKSLVEQLSLNDKVIFPGPLFGDAKWAALQQADAFVLPSITEAFPISVLEAWSAGTPTLISPACNLDFAYKNAAAFRIETDPTAMADDLLRFAALSVKERVAMGKAGHSLYSGRFTWRQIAQDALQLYTQVASQPRKFA